jgi:hypothetical protein
LVFLDIKCDSRCFLSPWEHLFAGKIRFWMSTPISFL